MGVPHEVGPVGFGRGDQVSAQVQFADGPRNGVRRAMVVHDQRSVRQVEFQVRHLRSVQFHPKQILFGWTVHLGNVKGAFLHELRIFKGSRHPLVGDGFYLKGNISFQSARASRII